jgi:hypothetical protein
MRIQVENMMVRVSFGIVSPLTNKQTVTQSDREDDFYLPLASEGTQLSFTE